MPTQRRGGRAARGKASRRSASPRPATHLADLTPDPLNARTHSPQNVGMIADSLRAVGAARSIVIDEKNQILAGHGLVDAAAEAGITKVRVVEADGETVIAVRRIGLTKAQKQRLAIYDNRTTELSTWNLDVLQQLASDGLDLAAFEFDVKVLGEIVSGVDAPGLPDGDKGDFEQMTFTLHRDQAVSVRAAMKQAQDAGSGVSKVNENSNGNALAAVCEAYRG